MQNGGKVRKAPEGSKILARIQEFGFAAGEESSFCNWMLRLNAGTLCSRTENAAPPLISGRGGTHAKNPVYADVRLIEDPLTRCRSGGSGPNGR